MESAVGWELCDAAGHGDVAGIAAALLAGANPNAFEGTSDWTPLQWAAACGHVAAIAALLAAGAHVDGMFRDWTPLILAASDGCTTAIDALVAAGADVHHASSDGDTALHRASYKGHPDASRALLDAGARTDLCNKRGERPIDVVRVPAC
jgi:ankyrin repeat protein